MEAKELKITPPEGYEIYQQKSTLEYIVFKPVDKKPKTWEEIQNVNKKNKKIQYYLSSRGDINDFNLGKHVDIDIIKSHINTKRQAERIRALCQLYIIADYYNDGWEASFKDKELPWLKNEEKYTPFWNNVTDSINASMTLSFTGGSPVFKSAKLLLEAYENNKEIFETALKP